MEELAAALANYRPLPAKETLLLIRRVQKHHAYWRQAQKTLLLRNLRLITKIALAWHRKFQSNVVTFDDLVAAGSLAKARELGKLRTEGKDYIVKDGDVIEFMIG